jgi:hypothetical protein
MSIREALAKIAEVFLKEHFVLTQVYVQFRTYP